jgi:uncharacterized repeat protein (TIGR03803 family)
MATAQAGNAQTFTILHGFIGNSSDGSHPRGSLIQASDGNLYGMAHGDDDTDYGTVFKITPSGTITKLHSFSSSGGEAGPYGSLVQASDGNLYGMTSGGEDETGIVFKITPSGTFTKLYRFGGDSDGGNPYGDLIQAHDGNLYGMTSDGGDNYAGTVFKITTSGSLTTLYSFTGGSDGRRPFGSLIQASDGNLYGMTSGGGNGGNGTVFQITTSGTLTTLHSFNGSDGSAPQNSLIQASDGNLYGMTAGGGGSGNGTIFRITTSGTLTTLYSFNGSDGATPYNNLIQASDGNLYGMTYRGGGYGNGAVFEITTSGTLTPLYSFTGGSDGLSPFGSLVQAGDGNLYGMTYYGGANGLGVIFAYTPPAPPPTVSGQLSPSPAGSGWYTPSTGSPTLNITGTGASITYTVTQNGTTASPVTVSGTSATVTFPSDGTYSVAFYATNSAGTSSATQTVTANIDTTPPVTYEDSTDNWVFLDGTDATSGVAITYYTIDAGSTQTYSDVIQLPQDNSQHTITYWSVDVAGNVESQNVATVDTRADTYVTAQDVAFSNLVSKTTLSATLNETDTDAPLANQTLSFSIGGSTVGTATTNSSGLATLRATLPSTLSAGPNTLTVSFAGSATQRPSQDTSTVTVSAATTYILVTSYGSAAQPIEVGTVISPVRANLESNNGGTLAGYTITYKMNGATIGTAVTASTNIASLASYTIPDTLPLGANTLTATFAGTTAVSGSTGTATYYIGSTGTKLNPVNRSGSKGSLIALAVTLKRNSDGAILAGKTVSFTFNGHTYTATTTASGIATAFVTLPSTKGTYTYGTAFAGTTYYRATSTSAKITVTN